MFLHILGGVMTSNYILTRSGEFLCKNNRFSSFPVFGTYPFCVKVYKSTGRALNTVKTLSQKFPTNELTVMTVDFDKVEKIGNENVYMNGMYMIVNNERKTFTQLIDDFKNGIDNQFPITFSFV